MAVEGHISAGEIGGVFAGIIAFFAMVGHGIKYMMGWSTAQQIRRAKDLDDRAAEIAAREARLDAEQDEYRRGIERDLADLRGWKARVETEHSALTAAYTILASAIRTIDPVNNALRMADELLRSAFRLDPNTPPEMMALLHSLDRTSP